MELPHLGEHCREKSCKKLDFLPIKCDACNEIFCAEHYHYTNHNCPHAYKKNNQVPVCPLCNKPIPVNKGQLPDVVVGAHIDNDCQSDPAKERKKVFSSKCTLKGCKTKEIIPIVCNDCGYNYCLKHRHPTDHKCLGKDAARRNKMLEAVTSRQMSQSNTQSRTTTNNSSSYTRSVQGTMSEDEALARALALSLEDENRRTTTVGGGERNARDYCNLS